MVTTCFTCNLGGLLWVGCRRARFGADNFIRAVYVFAAGATFGFGPYVGVVAGLARECAWD